MILDELTEFCDATALNTGAAGTYNIGDIIDLSVTAPEVGNGQVVYLVVQVTTAVTSAGAATVQFQLVSDATSTISTSTQTIHFISMAIPKATLVAGYTAIFPIAVGSPAYERFIGVQQVTGTAALTAGAVNAFLTLDPSRWIAAADASN